MKKTIVALAVLAGLFVSMRLVTRFAGEGTRTAVEISAEPEALGGGGGGGCSPACSPISFCCGGHCYPNTQQLGQCIRQVNSCVGGHESIAWQAEQCPLAPNGDPQTCIPNNGTDSVCVDTVTDPNNCGAVGDVCSGGCCASSTCGDRCLNGTCTIPGGPGCTATGSFPSDGCKAPDGVTCEGGGVCCPNYPVNNPQNESCELSWSVGFTGGHCGSCAVHCAVGTICHDDAGVYSCR